MRNISPKIFIDGREVDYLEGKYKIAGTLTAATLNFKLPLAYGGRMKLWNKEVTLYLNESDASPILEDG